MAPFKMQHLVPIVVALIVLVVAMAEAARYPTPYPSPSPPPPYTYPPPPSNPSGQTWTQTPKPPTPSTPTWTPTPKPPTPSTPAWTPTPKPPTPSPKPPTPSTPTWTPTPKPPTPSPKPPTPSTPTWTPTPKPPTPSPKPPTPSTPTWTPTPTPSTPSPSSTPSTYHHKAKCNVKAYPQCYMSEHMCPSTCPGACEVDCVSCKPVCKCDQPGAVCQDPRFIGGDGITFYFHGKKDQDFCLVSDNNLHINAHFIGKRNQNMGRDFTWVQSIAILFGKHQLYIGAAKTAAWDDSSDRLALSFDGQPILLPQSKSATWQSTTFPATTVTRAGGSTTNSIVVEVDGIFKITAKVVPITDEESRVHNYGISEEDHCFAHLDLGFKFLSLTSQVSGVLGKTYKPDYVSRVKIGANMPVMGGDRDFATSSLFAPDCSVARFNGGASDGGFEGLVELPSFECGSGLNGQGVVCKR